MGILMDEPVRRYRPTRDEAAEELRVALVRLARRRSRLRVAGAKHRRDVRMRIAEAVASGVSEQEAAAATGYKLETVTRWLSKQKNRARVVSVEKARNRLDLISQQRHRMTRKDLAISTQARALVRKAMASGITAEEFASLTGYTSARVVKWFASVRRTLEQAQRQRELIAVRRGKGHRPPQHLSEIEYDQWLAEADYNRRKVLRRYGLGSRINRPTRDRGQARRHHTNRQAPRKLPLKSDARRRQKRSKR